MANTEAIAAADRYRRARELYERAKSELVEASVEAHREVNMAGLSRRAGLHQSTLYHWVEKELRANGG